MSMRVAVIAVLLCLGGCGSKEGGGTPAPDGAAAANAAVQVAASMEAAPSRQQASLPAAARTLAGRSRELLDPDNSAVVLLYYDLAGLSPPIDDWVERDTRVQFARPADKDAQRGVARAGLEAAAVAVRDVGLLRLSLNASLSDYDPAYGEFTVRAFAPSSIVNFEAFGQTVSVRFGNGRDAQLWRVGADEARAIRDRIGFGGVTLDALLAITGIQPAPQGGAIVADVIEYEMRETLRGQLVGRVQVAAP